MPTARDPREVGERIEGLLQELHAVSDAPTREKAEQLVQLLVEMYGSGLLRITEIVAEEPNGLEMLSRLAADPLVASLLVLHDLHPVAAEVRILDALEEVRPYLGSHAGGVEFLGLDDEGVVHLKLQGSCEGCPSSTMTVKMAIEKAIMAAAPEVFRVEAEGLAEAAAPRLLQIESLAGRKNGESTGSAGGWRRLEALGGVLPGAIQSAVVDGFPVLICSARGNLYAYRNACSACGSALERGTLLDAVLTCPTCGSRYDVRLAGRAGQEGEPPLEPLPLLPEEGGWKVAIPAGVEA
jgi:Fe-S cluster biogenesis protein NfuA/nitrite reductase/ring-hydroxylating ferredoxin subunit